MNDTYTFTLRGIVPALKNERQFDNIKLTKATYNQKEVQELINRARINRPGPDVKQFIQEAKQRYIRVMKMNGWEVIRLPVEVAVFIELGVVYGTDLPKSDLDNACTTIQESLFTAPPRVKGAKLWTPGPVLEDDRQIGTNINSRIRFVNSDLTYSKVWITLRGTPEHMALIDQYKLNEMERAKGS